MTGYVYAAIEGTKQDDGSNIFEVGQHVRLSYENDEVRVETLHGVRLGHLTNTLEALPEGCLSADQVLVRLGREAEGVIRFIFQDTAIVELLDLAGDLEDESELAERAKSGIQINYFWNQKLFSTEDKSKGVLIVEVVGGGEVVRDCKVILQPSDYARICGISGTNAKQLYGEWVIDLGTIEAGETRVQSIRMELWPQESGVRSVLLAELQYRKSSKLKEHLYVAEEVTAEYGMEPLILLEDLSLICDQITSKY